MSRVPVVLIEDRAVRTDEMNLPQQFLGFEFVLEQEDYIKSNPQFTRCVERIRRLRGMAIVLLDLGFDEVTLDSAQSSEVSAWLATVRSALLNILNLAQINGAYVAMCALQNENWQGELLIAASDLGPRRRNELAALIRKAERNPDVRIRFVDDVPGNPEGVTSQAIEFFLQDFDVIQWFLRPPPIGGTAKEWFDSTLNAHLPHLHSYKIHLDAVRQRFPEWASGEASAKALVHSKDYTVLKGRRPFPVYCLKEFFGADMSFGLVDLLSSVALPTEPGLPFLVALQRLMDKLREGASTPVRLLHLDRDSLALGIEPGRSCRDLAESLKNGHNGDTCRGFRNATNARVQSDSNTEEYPLNRLLVEGFEGAATPWITEDFVGVLWKTEIIEMPSDT
jgi:hypothetical protein